MASSAAEQKHSDLGGVRILAETLHHFHGNRVTCPNCPRPDLPARAYCKDEGGNSSEGGLRRRQFRCRNSRKKAKEDGHGCTLTSCATYVRRAIETLGEDKVEEVRAELVPKLRAAGRDVSKIERRILASPFAVPTTSIAGPTIGSIAAIVDSAATPKTHPKVAETPKRRRPDVLPTGGEAEKGASTENPLRITDTEKPKGAILPSVGSPAAAVRRNAREDNDQPAPKRVRLESPTKIECQLAELSRQVRDLSERVGEVQTLLKAREVDVEQDDAAGFVDLNYDYEGLDWGVEGGSQLPEDSDFENWP